VLYTDGISEAQNHAGEEYGIPAMRSLVEGQPRVCPNLLVQACREHVDVFRNGHERTDDETLLAIQYLPVRSAAEYASTAGVGHGAA